MRTVPRGARRGSIRTGWDDEVPAEKEAVALAAKVGIDLPDRPAGHVPRLPAEPTDLDDAALMRLFRELMEWSTYADARLAVAEVEERSLVDTLDLTKARLMLHHRGEDEKTMTAAKGRMAEDPEYVEAKQAVDEIYARRKVLGTLAESLDRRSTFLSRELTRRVGRDPRDQRNGKWGGG